MTDPAGTAVLGWQRTIEAIARQLTGGGPGHEPPLPPWNVTSPSAYDGLLWDALAVYAAYLAENGSPHAAAALGHYQDNTGTDFTIDPSQLMQDVPSFQRDVAAYVAAHPGAFDSGWINTNTDITDANGNVTGQQSMDWYYALHDWRYRITGTTDNYTVQVYKPYVFGSPRSDLNIPLITKWTGMRLPQNDVEHLNAAGIARNFVVTGTVTRAR